MASVEVHQLQSKHGKAFMNVEEEYGYVGIWGSCYKTPTYLLQDGIAYTIICFDDEEYAQEWLDKNSNKYFSVIEIKETQRINQ